MASNGLKEDRQKGDGLFFLGVNSMISNKRVKTQETPRVSDVVSLSSEGKAC
jgi:hypothetical protein